MTQPRKEQIKSVNTRYTYLEYLGTPGSPETVLVPGTINPFLTTDTPGGAEEDVFAVVQGTVLSPYPILAGDAITIRLDGGPAQLVTFAGTDTTVSRCAARINSVVGGPLASNLDGRLRLVSFSTGSSASIEVSDSTPGTLAKFGITAGTYSGLTGPSRGVLTRTRDLLGGKVHLATTDGLALTTEAAHMVGDSVLGRRIYYVDVPAGLPIRGRLTFDGTNYVVRYFADLPATASVTTFNSTFSLIDGTDSVTITIDGVPIVVTFPAFPYTRDGIIDRINEIFQTLTGGFGFARIVASVTGPYNHPGSSLRISVDGGAPVTVNVPSITDTVDELVTLLNGAVAGITASTSTLGSKKFLVIQSNNTNGRTSSVEVIPEQNFAGLNMASAAFLRMIGVPPGLYRGSWIAEPYGPDEIRIRSVTRGASSTLGIAGSATTLTRLGLTSGTVIGSDQAVPTPVRLPRVRSNLTDAAPYTIRSIVPEVEEFGDVPANTDSRVQDLVARTFASSLQGFNGIYLDPGSGNTTTMNPVPGGLFSAGRAAETDAFGSISESSAQSVYDWFDNQLRQILRLNTSRDVQAVVSTLFETPGTNGNTRAKSPFMVMDVDPDNSQSGRNFRVRFARDAVGFIAEPLNVIEAPATGIPWGVDSADAAGSVLTAFGNRVREMNLYDLNTIGVGNLSGGQRYVPFSSSTAAEGDQYVRILDKEVSNDLVGKSVLHRMNAPMVVTVGDGTDSFGDFNGPDAILAAFSFAASKSVSQFVVQVKRGLHSISGPIPVPSSGNVRIEGVNGGGTLIVPSGLIALSVGALANLELRDLSFFKAAAPFSIITMGNGVLRMKDVDLFNVVTQFSNTTSCVAERCRYFCATASADAPLILFSFGSGTTIGPYVFRDCGLFQGDNNPVLRVRAANGLTTIAGPFVFDTCSMALGTTTVDGNGNLVGNCGVVDMDPNGFDSLDAAAGLVVRGLEFRNCEVRSSSGAVKVLLHLVPIANGSATTAAPFAQGDPAIRINSLLIRGGKWLCPRGSTSVNPFTVGMAWTATGALATDINDIKSGNVVIEDVVMGFDPESAGFGGDMGNPTQDVGSFFGDTVVGSAVPLAADWGAWAIAANYLVMRNVQLVSMSQQGTCGDLFVKCDRDVLIDGIRIADYEVAAGPTAPNQRIRLRFGYQIATGRGGPVGVIRNVHVLGKDTFFGTWGTNVIRYEASQTPIRIEDVEVHGFQVASANTMNGFVFVNAAVNALYGAIGAGNTNVLDKFELSRFHGTGLQSGITMINSLLTLREWAITDCVFTECNFGMTLISSVRIGALTLHRNKVYRNGGGIYVSVGDWTSPTSFDPSVVMISNNVVHDNPGTGVQIQLETVGGTQAPKGIIQGNVLHTISSTQASLKVNQTSGGVPTALTSPNSMDGGGPGILRGLETGVTALGPPTTYRFVSGGSMVQNQGFIVTP